MYGIPTSKYLHIVLSILFSVNNLKMANWGPKHFAVIAFLPTLLIKYLLCLWLQFTPFYIVVYRQQGCRTLKKLLLPILLYKTYVFPPIRWLTSALLHSYVARYLFIKYALYRWQWRELCVTTFCFVREVSYAVIQGVSKRALQLWKLIEIYTEDIRKVLNCQNVAKHTEFYLE